MLTDFGSVNILVTLSYKLISGMATRPNAPKNGVYLSRTNEVALTYATTFEGGGGLDPQAGFPARTDFQSALCPTQFTTLISSIRTSHTLSCDSRKNRRLGNA
jgi:hypothetical protein